jgi:hypothetical protein
MAIQGDAEREEKLKEAEKCYGRHYKFTIRIGGKIINQDDPVTVVRSNGNVERDWLFVNFNPMKDIVAVRKFIGNQSFEKFPCLADFTEWQSR